MTRPTRTARSIPLCPSAPRHWPARGKSPPGQPTTIPSGARIPRSLTHPPEPPTPRESPTPRSRNSRKTRPPHSPHCLDRLRTSSPAHVSALSSPVAKPASGPVIRGPPGRSSRSCSPAFLPPFGRPASASWAPCPAREFSPPYGRLTALPAHTRACTADPDGVSTFRTHETRTGPGALSTPGTAVSAGHRYLRGRRLPPPSGRSLPSRYSHPARDVYVTRHQQGFPDSRPVPVLPLTCDRHGWNGGPWAFP